MINFEKTLESDRLSVLVVNQLNNFIPDGCDVFVCDIKMYVEEALERVFANFSKIKTKYYREGNKTLFSHLMSDHYCVFLYYLCNSMYRSSANIDICTKIFMLNKYLHGIDAFYSISLPDHFMVVHPIGTILGNATYGDYLVVYQNCTIGASIEGIYPTFGDGCIMYSGCAAIGNMTIGDNVLLARAASVVNTSIPKNSIVFGSNKDLVIKQNNKTIIDTIFER